MRDVDRVALDLLYLALEHVRLTYAEYERDDIVGLIIGQVYALQDSLTEYWRGHLTELDDDELPF